MNQSQGSALNMLKQRRPKIAVYERGLPDPGFDGLGAEAVMRRINESYYQGNKVYSMSWQIAPELHEYNLGNGSPLSWPPFPCATQEISALLDTDAMSQYAFAAGDADCRKRVASYLQEMGFHSNSPDGCILPSQLIFFHSTTEAFSILMSLICEPGDVVLFTAPSYGLFAYAPERAGAHAHFFPLRSEDNWLLNTEALEHTIVQINDALTPGNRVVAFLNMNPHNPTGRVMGKEQYALLSRISGVCKRRGVFLIDDIIYRDLCYNMQDPALPMACIPGTFDHTITLFGPSKSYGLAGARAGAVFADEAIIRGLRNKIFQQMDSTSLLVSHIMAGVFQCGKVREKAYQAYFSDLIDAYRKNWLLVRLMISGRSQYAQMPEESILHSFYAEFAEDAEDVLEHGIPPLTFAGNIAPESGFFALIDFTGLIGRRWPKTGQIIRDEIDVVYFFFRAANVKLLTGGSFAWPDPKQIISRVSFAYSVSDLLRAFHQIKKAIDELI